MSARRSQLEPLAEAGSTGRAGGARRAPAHGAPARDGPARHHRLLGPARCRVRGGAAPRPRAGGREPRPLRGRRRRRRARRGADHRRVPPRRLRRDDPQEHLDRPPETRRPSSSCRRSSWSRGSSRRSSTRWTGSPRRSIRLFGVEPKDEVASAFTAEEVAHILDESRDEGLVGAHDYERLGAALEFSDKDAGGRRRPPRRARHGDRRRHARRHRAARRQARLLAVPRRATGRATSPGYLHLKDVLYADDEERHEPVPGQAGPPAGHRAPRRRGRVGARRRCRTAGRTWPGSSPTTARCRGRLPRGRHRGARRRGLRRLAALTATPGWAAPGPCGFLGSPDKPALHPGSLPG